MMPQLSNQYNIVEQKKKSTIVFLSPNNREPLCDQISGIFFIYDTILQ